MPPSPPRRLNLIDGMILVAGVAAGIALTRLFLQSSNGAIAEPAIGAAGWVIQLWLAVFSPLVLILRFRPPRPARSRALRQPGASACLAATVVVTLEVACWAVAAAIEGEDFSAFLDPIPMSMRVAPAGAAVAALWGLAALTRRWNPERSFIDRAGRLIGVGWIVAFLALLGFRSTDQIKRHRDQLQSEQYYANFNAGIAQAEADLDRYDAELKRANAEWSRKVYQDKRNLLNDLGQYQGDPARMEKVLADMHQTLDELEAKLADEEQARDQAHPPGSSPTPPGAEAPPGH